MDEPRMRDARKERPNVLFVLADQLRGCSVGHAGQEPVLTPNLDRFADESLRLTRAVANAPVCCPMRASLLTGLHPLAHGVITNDVALPVDVVSIADVLSQNGYHTAYIGKWHLDGPDRGCFTPPGARRHGFQFWAAANCHHNYFEGFYYRDDPEPLWFDDYEPCGQTDLAIEYLANIRRADAPFFLFLSWGPPHCPYEQVPLRFRQMYDAEQIPLRPNVVQADREVIAGYYAHVTALDWNFGRLLRALDRLGLCENTIVVFTSDHGDMLFSHNRGWKCKPWHESVIVPFLIRWPGRVPAGAIDGTPFGLVDVMPSLLGLCGISVPDHVQGMDLSHVLLGKEGFRPRSQIIHQHHCPRTFSFREWRGVITATHTYARFRDQGWVLYDDIRDPYQMQNLIESEEAKNLRAQLDEEVSIWLERLEDEFEPGEELTRRRGLKLDENGIYPCYYQPELLREINKRAAQREIRMQRSCQQND